MRDKVVIEALKNRDTNALKQVYSNNRLAFLGFAKKYPITKEDVIDIYQDAIIALRDNAVNGMMNDLKSEIKTYLFSIGKYMIYDKLRQQNKIHLIEDISGFMHTESTPHMNNNELTYEQKQLQAAFKTLGQKCKDVLTLFYYRGFDLEEIMKELNYTNKDVVKSQKSRCIKSLKTMIFKSQL